MSDRTAFYTGALIYNNNQPTEAFRPNHNNRQLGNITNQQQQQQPGVNNPMFFNSSSTPRNLYNVDGVNNNNKTQDTTRFLFAQNEAYEKQLEFLRADYDKLKLKYDKEKDARENAEAQVVELHDKMTALRVPTEHLRSRIARLEREAGEARLKLEDAEKALQDANNKSATLEAQVTALHNDNNKHLQEINKLQESEARAQKAEEETNRNQQTVAALTCENEDLKKELEDLNIKYEEYKEYKVFLLQISAESGNAAAFFNHINAAKEKVAENENKEKNENQDLDAENVPEQSGSSTTRRGRDQTFTPDHVAQHGK